MSDTPSPALNAPIAIGADLTASGCDTDAAALTVLSLVRACQYAAASLRPSDRLAYLELADALAVAEISALRLIAEATQTGHC
jgi:hypothetical protein